MLQENDFETKYEFIRGQSEIDDLEGSGYISHHDYKVEYPHLKQCVSCIIIVKKIKVKDGKKGTKTKQKKGQHLYT
jgi:ribosomal protein S26